MRYFFIILLLVFSGCYGQEVVRNSSGELAYKTGPVTKTTYETEAIAYYNRLVAKGVTLSDAEYSRVNKLVYLLKNTLGRDATTSYWNSLDALRLPGETKTQALENLISSSYTGVITNDYGGSYTANVGLKGNGTNFHVNTGVNFSTTVKATQDNSSIGILVLDDKAGNDNQDLCALKAGGADGCFLWVKRASATSYDIGGALNGTYTGITNNARTILSSRAWYHIERNSGSYRFYINGYRFNAISVGSGSTAPGNIDVVEFASSVTGTIANWSSLTHALFYAGNANIEQNILIQIINESYLLPLANSSSSIYNRIAFFGDSMTGDETNSNTALSDISEYPRRTITNLGSNWSAHQNGDANREVSGAALVPSLASIMDIEVLGGTSGQQTFENTSFTKDVTVFFIGTNDLAFNAVSTGTALKSALDTEMNKVLAQGKRVLIATVAARDGGFLSGQTKANFDAARASYRTLLLADFTEVTGVANCWKKPGEDFYLMDINADARFNDETNATYFETDKIHFKLALFDIFADEYITPLTRKP